MKQLHTASLIALIALGLAACGNKGPLVSVQKPVPVEEAMPPVESPPPTDPADPAPVEEIAPPADADPVPSTPA
ncbi:MAG: lipoprotein [Pseudomonadota bacterium]|nr:lipoprotein [Pseudomonadota bacterium]MDQ3228771.1 lipoprotein [Pseudomonadota bacterium]